MEDVAKGTVIKLSTQELYLGSMIGLRRRIASMQRGLSEMRGVDSKSPAEQWYYNIVGALGELAFAKAAGLYWAATINAKKESPDVSPDWQVRCLAQPHYDLIVRMDDLDDQKYVLMTGTNDEFVFRGWIYGRDGKKEEWLKDRGNRGWLAYWVPQASLFSIEKEN